MRSRFLTFYFKAGVEISGKSRIIEQSLICIEEEMGKKYKVGQIERGKSMFVLYSHDLSAKGRIKRELERFHFMVEDIK
jgi:predicted GTPase